MTKRIFTIGYGGLKPTDFVALLQDHGIAQIVDVRIRPDKANMGSYKLAETPDRGIGKLLGDAGIGYAHFLELGNLFLALDDWEPRYRALIAAAGPILLARLRSIAGPCCLLCAENDVAECHRGIIADQLAKEGYEVVHL